jgi:hypothetical protein
MGIHVSPSLLWTARDVSARAAMPYFPPKPSRRVAQPRPTSWSTGLACQASEPRKIRLPVVRRQDTEPWPRVAVNRTRETRSQDPDADAATACRQGGRCDVPDGPGGVVNRDRLDLVPPPRTHSPKL